MFPSVNMCELPAELRWRCVSPKANERWAGVLAGPVVECVTHYHANRTVPCLEWITGGKVDCPCAEVPMGARRTGYAPLMLKDRSKVVVIVSDTTVRALTHFKPGAAIEIARGKAVQRPCVVTSVPPESLGDHFTKVMKQAAVNDIRRYLLHLWQAPALFTFFKVERFDPLRLKKAKQREAVYFPQTSAASA